MRAAPCNRAAMHGGHLRLGTSPSREAMQKKRLLVAASLALTAASAHAQGIEVKLSGQVNRGVMFVDDGVQSDAFHVDNDNSSTRFRFTGTGEVSPGLKAGLVFE